MATYKVLQDIEAEDKILGPLTLRQFIYGLIAAFLLYICFICISQGAPYLLVLFLPPALFTGFFALPFGKDQPTEVWALAKIRFLFKPRRRIWDQSGVKELVTVTAPKRVEVVLTNGLTQNEVQSRLQALAQTIDSRGWAIKNVNVNLYDQSGVIGSGSSDRLIDTGNLPQEVPNYDVQASDDMLAVVNNPIAQQFDHMINTSEQTHRQELIDELNTVPTASASPATAGTPVAKPGDYWFLNQPQPPATLPPTQAMFDGAQVVQPGSDDTAVPAGTMTADEVALAARLKAQNASSRQVYHSHLRTIQPLGSQPPASAAGANATQSQAAATNQSATDNSQSVTDNASTPPTPSTPQHDPAILSLASNDDLNVATLAREAYKVKNPDGPLQDEVVISLH
jgi:hypothetical protein